MEFDKEKFIRGLLDAPAEVPFLEPAEHSEYLQKEVFDKLNADEAIDLMALDWNAFELRHVTPEDYARKYDRIHEGWLMGINHFLRITPAVSVKEKGFF